MHVDRDIVLEVKGLSHGFGASHVLFDINLEIVRGEILALVGPSGCGKSTFFRAVVGTHPPRQGQLTVYTHTDNGGVESKPITGPGRDRGIVYQQYSLFPFLTAQQNVAFGLMLDQTNVPFRMLRPLAWRRLRKKHMAMAAEFLDQVGLGHALKLYPANMSGGMRQRVAVAQALIMKPEIVLLDEPFGALDEATREELQDMLLTLYFDNCRASKQGQRPPYTIVIVTHEINEAILVGDRVVGVTQQWDWKAEGHAACPGATIVYDKAAPVELPNQERHYEAYAQQRREIRDTVFEPKTPVPRTQHQTFWDQVKAGEAEGIFGGTLVARKAVGSPL